MAQGGMAQMNTRARFKSIYIMNFTKYTEWPSDYKQGDFIIGVVNDDALAAELEKIGQQKKINSQNLVVKRFKSPAEVTKCHLLYVDGAAAEVEPYVQKAKQYNCLIVTEGSGLIDKLSAINFIVVGNAIKYEMNRAMFKEQKLIVSNSLENLAAKVIN